MRIRRAAFAFVTASLLYAQKSAPTSSDDTAQPNPAAAAPESPAFVACPAGSPLGAIDLRVEAGDQPLAFRTINHLSEGDVLRYSPILRGKEKRAGDVALVLVPEKRLKGQEDIIVTEPKPAGSEQEWKMTQTISVAALVYGPTGLNRKKVARFLSQDEVLVAQLADYADKTAQAEQLVAALSDSESSSASVNAALNGFASQYGFAVQINRNANVATQAETVFAAMNPQLATYNPLATSTAARTGQTASLATMAATLFFGSPIGLAAGGTAMLLDLRSIAFPDTQFRASFALPRKDSGVDLCGQEGAVPPHTRVAYIWANRIPNLAAPAIRLKDPVYIPLGQKSPVAVELPERDWKYLDRARQWALAGDSKKKVPVPVAVLGNQKALEVDLTKVSLPPGDYRLSAFWDWTPLEPSGTLHILPLSDFQKAHLASASQDRLLAQSGKTAARIEGSDFEFVTKVELKKLNDEFASAEDVRFVLPKGPRQGPQDHLDVQIDTQDLDPGSYELLLSQSDGNSHPVPFKILPNPPKFENLPILVNQGAGEQHFTLKGARLNLIAKLEAPGATFRLSPAAADQTERGVTVSLKPAANRATSLDVKAWLEDRSEPLTLANALEITGPLPVIASSKLSLPAGLAIAVRSGEFPAGATLNALLDVKNIESSGVLRLKCADGAGRPAELHIGEQTAHSNLEQISADQLFLAFDTSNLPAGCQLQAVIDNGRGGRSQPFPLARILRLPRIDSFTLAQNSTPDAAARNDAPGNTAPPSASPQNPSPQTTVRQYQLTGANLEMIEKLGWDRANPVAVTGLPVPLPGPGLEQSISIDFPDPPAPDAPLYLWLRGDKEGRLASLKWPALPQPAPEPPAAAPPVTAPPVVPAPSTEPSPPAPQPQ